MRHINVDPDAKLARVRPGCLLKDVDRATQEQGLATVLGFISEVGVVGLTLGGGLGYLTRRFGWTVDNLEEVEIVTADSRIRRASREENPDVFWAIRGAGANLGVVASFAAASSEPIQGLRAVEAIPLVTCQAIGGWSAWQVGKALRVPLGGAATLRLPGQRPRAGHRPIPGLLQTGSRLLQYLRAQSAESFALQRRMTAHITGAIKWGDAISASVQISRPRGHTL
jgi:FAD binding domain